MSLAPLRVVISASFCSKARQATADQFTGSSTASIRAFNSGGTEIEVLIARTMTRPHDERYSIREKCRVTGE
jgi:hypothetical protein